MRYLRIETTGGLILLGATCIALILANTSAVGWYRNLSEFSFGPAAFHLDLTVAGWATDGLLSVFFLVAGLELKRELVQGELSNVRNAMLPVFAAAGGMVAPALVAVTVAAGTPGASKVWPVPTATDIAFALAVLAVVASALPASVRVFLLSLAVVDDLGAITLIAILFTEQVHLLPLAASLACVAVYALLQRLRVRLLPLYVVLGVAAWATLHAAGIHSTIAGVLIAFATRVGADPGERESPGTRLEHALQPVSAGLCVPVFAFFAAGITLDASAVATFTTDRVALAVVAGLLIGKLLGVMSGAGLAVVLRLAKLPADMSWRDLTAVALLTGCGFTVSLLITELAFEDLSQRTRVKAAVLVGSVLSALLAAILLRIRVRKRV